MATKTYKRAGVFAPGIGRNLKEIEGQDVLLVRFSVSERPFEDGTNTITIMELALDVDKPEVTETFHIWSDSMAQKIAEIPSEELPLLITFQRVTTRRGLEAWTFS